MRFGFATLVLCLLGACAAPVARYDGHYTQIAPETYPARESAELVAAGEDADALYKALFADIEVVGRLDFTEPAARSGSFIGYAKKVGADMALVARRFVETEERTDYEPYQAPVHRYRKVRTGDGKIVYAPYVDYQTRFRLVTRRYDIYAQEAIFLRNGLAAAPFAPPPRETAGAGDPMDIAGLWENTNMHIRVYRAGEDYAGVLETLKPDGEEAMEEGITSLLWSPGDLVLRFDAASGDGFALDADRAPRPATFAVNRFGYLEAAAPDSFGPAPAITFRRAAPEGQN